MEEYRRRLERTQIKIWPSSACSPLRWALGASACRTDHLVTVIMAIHIRVTHVIARREDLLERGRLKHETHGRTAWYDPRERRIVTSGVDDTWILETDPRRKKGIEMDLTLSQNRTPRLPKRSKD
jgi:hypothetical protein